MKLRIEKQVYGGSGLARFEGKTIFVPFAAPGEVVEAEIAEDRGSYANANLVRILESSPTRTAPACPYFTDCGGCQYQHAQYDAQIAWKIGILREALERAHVPGIPEVLPVHDAPLGYRNRVRLHVERSPFALAYKRRASHINLPVDACPIAAPPLVRAMHAIHATASEHRLDEWAQEIELFLNGSQDQMLLSLSTRAPQPQVETGLRTLFATLQPHIASLTGAAAFAAAPAGDAAARPAHSPAHRPARRKPLPSSPLAHAGADSLTYSVAGQPYRVSHGSFFQINRLLLDRLVSLVCGGQSGTLAWDLYAGVGLFARALASSFQQVTAVETAGPSARDLTRNLPGKPHRAVAVPTLDFLRRAVRERHPRPDLVVVDPPRAGLGREVTALLGQLRPRRITYVSCDPATLSRDLRALVESGYQIHQLHMVDLFPQTFHLESIAHLTLG